MNSFSILIFRLGREWVALPTIFFKEVTHRRPVHRLPHQKGKILQGLVNLNGKLELSVALHELLEIEAFIAPSSSVIPYQLNRMVAIVKEGALWVFPVDEMNGIYHWNLAGMEQVPTVIARSSMHYVKGVIKVENKRVVLLDEELLFCGLKKCLHSNMAGGAL